jgi:hypothetical protein
MNHSKSPSPGIPGQAESRGRGGPAWMLAALCVLVAAVPVGGAAPTPARPAQAPDVSAVPEIKLRGRVVDLSQEMHRLYQVELPDQHPHLLGFRTDDGRYFTLLWTRYSKALFVDPRLRKKELILKGRVYPHTRLFDVSSMQSVRNGVVCDLYYYCYTCSIRALAPGPCECCQQPVVLVEKPHVH